MHPWLSAYTTPPARVEPADFLAAIGYWHVLGDDFTHVANEDDEGEWEAARATDHRLVRSRLTADQPKPRANKDGAVWGPWSIKWPDRVPGLKTWAGNMTLPKLIAKLQAALTPAALAAAGDDLAKVAVPLKGVSGLDRAAAGSSLDIGFSPSELDIPVVQRPAVELLAIIGLNTLPLVSWDTRECGWIYDGRIWRMTVEHRAEYYYRWGQAYVAEPA